MKILRNYQKEVINTLHKNIEDNKISVVGLCPNAGKTLISLRFIEEYLVKYPANKILMLCEGQDVLRKQNYSVMYEDISEGVKFCRLDANNIVTYIEDGKEVSTSLLDLNNFDVVITLPQTIDNKELPFKFDLVIVDEAHNRYFSEQLQRVINNNSGCNQILMTGTPSSYIQSNLEAEESNKELPFDLIIIPMVDIYYGGLKLNEKWFANTSYYVSSTNISIDDIKYLDLYNDEDELKRDVVLSEEDNTLIFDNAIEKLITEQIKYLKESESIVSKATSLVNSFSNSFNFKNIAEITNNKLIQQAINSLGKTMWVCYSQDFARLVHKKLVDLGINTLISISDNIGSDVNINIFQEDESVKCLVVVNRATLGFNMPELSNVVDLTGSRNLNRIYQLYSRITRVSKNSLNKRYFKIGFKNEVELTKQVMNCALSLMGDNIKLYNGTNSKTINFIDKVKVTSNVCKETSYTNDKNPSVTKDDKRKNKKNRKQDIIDLSGLDILDVFTDLQFNLSNTYGLASKSNLVTVYESYGMWKGGNPSKRKEEIIEFIKTNNKKPSKYSKNLEEKRLGVLLYSYTNLSSSVYDETFKQQVYYLCKELDIKQKDNSIENKEEIKEFIKINLRKPSSNSKNLEEKRLGSLLYGYTSPSKTSYDEVFKKQIEDLCKELNIKPFYNSVSHKEEIIEFIKTNNKKPSRSSKNLEEKRLGVLLYGYTSPSKTSYDEVFKKQIEDLCNELNIKPAYNSQENKQLILKFIKTNNKKPSYSSKNLEEKRLGKLLSSYTSPSSSTLDEIFKQQVEDLCNELNILSRKQKTNNPNIVRVKGLYNLHKPVI